MDVSGIYIVVKNKEEALEIFESLKKRYGFLHGGYNSQQQQSLFKSYCHDVASAIKECFEFQMLGPNKCLKKISQLETQDNAFMMAQSDIHLNAYGCQSAALTFCPRTTQRMFTIR